MKLIAVVLKIFECGN